MRYPAEEIFALLPAEHKTTYDVREVLYRLVDGSRLHEFKADFGTTLVRRAGAGRA